MLDKIKKLVDIVKEFLQGILLPVLAIGAAIWFALSRTKSLPTESDEQKALDLTMQEKDKVSTEAANAEKDWDNVSGKYVNPDGTPKQ